jgi:hypothetical protein
LRSRRWRITSVATASELRMRAIARCRFWKTFRSGWRVRPDSP